MTANSALMLAEPPWWRDTFFNGVGPAVVSAASAVLVAWLTVRWTMEGTREAARPATHTERSHASAKALAVSLGDAWSRIAKAPPGNLLDLGQWFLDVSLYSPDLSDLEVMERVDQVSAELSAFDAWMRQPMYGAHGVALEKIAEHAARINASPPRVRWLGQTLAAHRNDMPLPAPPRAPTLS
jgi:hypothetical protein